MRKVIIIIMVALLGSCTTPKYVEVERHTIDTLRETKVLRDSFYIHDSIFVNQWQHGDTIYQVRDRWRTQYVSKAVHDTVYRARIDSVPVPYPVEKEVPSQLTWWQQARLHLANILLWLVGLVVVIKVGRWHLSRLRIKS